MIFRNKIHQHGSSNLRMSENAHRKEEGRGVNLLNKFLPPCEPPLSPGSSPDRPFYGPPALGGPSPPGIREAAERPPEKSQKVTGNAEPRWGRSSAEKGCFPFKKEQAERTGRVIGWRRRCPGPGAGRDRRRQRRAAEDPQLESAAQRSPRAGGRRRG